MRCNGWWESKCYSEASTPEVRTMKRFVGLFGVFALSAAGLVYAHAHLLQATPADGSVLTQAPTVFALKFNEAATLTALSIQKGSEGPQKIDGLPSKPAAQ